MRIRARVFMKDGNRFLIPGYWCDEDDENWQGMSIMDILCEGMMFGILYGCDAEQEWIDVVCNDDGTADLVNVPIKLTGRALANGAMDVLLIGGPLFDEAMKETAA